MRIFFTSIVLLLFITTLLSAATLVDIPMDKQINVGLGDAISKFTSFGTDPGGGYARLQITQANGAGGWYYGPEIDLVKAGYGAYLDFSLPDTTIEYTARYYQGGGNTNPYGDAPIFVRLTDVNGKTAGLGISYGAQPNPRYPAWITCTDDMSTEGNWPNDDGFDISKVTKITFFGTDWAGKGNDFIDVRNLKVTNSVPQNSNPVSIAKSAEDGADVEVCGLVSAVFPSVSQFYIQDKLRSCGIQVRNSNMPGVGASVIVTGTVRTDSTTGEMYIEADNWLQNGVGKVKPVGIVSKNLVGGAFARQQGLDNGNGLNNVGLLVRLHGKVTGQSADTKFIYLTDGVALSDGGSLSGVRIDFSGIPFWKRATIFTDDNVTVTGISSLYVGTDGKVHPMIRLREVSDFINPNDDGNRYKTIRAAVINFDPVCPSYGKRKTHQVLGWNNPLNLANEYINDLKNSSGNWCRYQIVSWYDANYHPYFEDGFRYTPDEYIYAWNNRSDQNPMHSGTTDYIRLITDKTYPHNLPKSIAERIADDEIDEVFFFGAPYGFAGWEAAMAGPSPFFVNGGTYVVPSAGRNFVMMGFNYERGVDCMLEDFLHRTECTMSRVYNPPNWWFPTYPPTNNWDKFRMFDKIQPGAAACGICHYAPNSISDYDWGNSTYVWSTCDDWLYNWPNLKGDVTKRLVNKSEWGNGDMRLHHIWWLEHLPKAPGINPDGKQNNWWKYPCDFNNYPESR